MSANHDPLAAFELPPEVMTYTFEHAISDHADSAHESGHAVASVLQSKLRGAIAEFGYPGKLTVRLASGAIAHCGGPGCWNVDVAQPHGEEPETLNVAIPDDEADPARIADALASVLRHW